MHERKQAINSEILNEVVDISFKNCHENSLHDSFKDQFDKVLEELHLEHFCHGKQITENFAGYHDPVEEYMEKLCSGNGWLCLYSKDQFLYHNLFPLSLSSLFFTKHEEKIGLWDNLLDWIHWNSGVT